MPIIKLIVEAAMALFILFIFGALLLPELAKVTGQSTTLFALSLFILGISVIVSVIAVIVKVIK